MKGLKSPRSSYWQMCPPHPLQPLQSHCGFNIEFLRAKAFHLLICGICLLYQSIKYFMDTEGLCWFLLNGVFQSHMNYSLSSSHVCQTYLTGPHDTRDHIKNLYGLAVLIQGIPSLSIHHHLIMKSRQHTIYYCLSYSSSSGQPEPQAHSHFVDRPLGTSGLVLTPLLADAPPLTCPGCLSESQQTCLLIQYHTMY